VIEKLTTIKQHAKIFSGRREVKKVKENLDHQFKETHEARKGFTLLADL
jgi:ABC-type enterochelin transport system substrate-binding protein